MSLVLSLRKEESITTNGPVTITFCGQDGNVIRLAFDCSRETIIERDNYVPKNKDSKPKQLKSFKHE